jgi:hypothetical protein
MIRGKLRVTAIGLATLAALAGIVVAALFALDHFVAEYPQQSRRVQVWIEDALGIGDPSDHFVVAFELDRPEALVSRLLQHEGSAAIEVYGHTLLTLAFDSPPARAIAPETIALVLEAGADPNRRDADGRLPIVEAGRFGDPARLAPLLDHGADPNGVDGWGAHVLDRACSSRCIDLGGFVRLLLDHGFDPCTIVRPTVPTWVGDTAVRPIEEPLSNWLVARGLADLADRAQAACTPRRR